MYYLDRIFSYCRRLGISQYSFEKGAGLSRGQISKWKNGVRPGVNSLQKAASFMNITFDELISEEDHAADLRIPLADPYEESDHIHVLPDSVSDPDECFAVVIRDDSMEPQIHKGDYVILDRSVQPDSGDIAAVFEPGSPATCRKILIDDSGIILQPFNIDYDAEYYRPSEIKEMHIEVKGRIVSQIHQF